MSIEENVHLDDTTDEQFKYVKRASYSDVWQSERCGIKTILSLVAWIAACVALHNIAHYIRDSHRVSETGIPQALTSCLPYVGAAFILLTVVMVLVLLYVLAACVHVWYEGDLSPRAIILILWVLLPLVGFAILSVICLSWYYSL